MKKKKKKAQINPHCETRHIEFKVHKLFVGHIGAFSNFVIQNSLNETSYLCIHPIVHLKEDLDHSNFFPDGSFESSKFCEENSYWHFWMINIPKR